MHTRDHICVGHQDGSLVIFNLRGECLAACEPPSTITEPITAVAIREAKNVIVASTSNHVLQWILADKDNKNPAWVYVLRFVLGLTVSRKTSPGVSPIQDLFFHSQMSLLICVSKHGNCTLFLSAVTKEGCSFLQGEFAS